MTQGSIQAIIFIVFIILLLGIYGIAANHKHNIELSKATNESYIQGYREATQDIAKYQSNTGNIYFIVNKSIYQKNIVAICLE